MRKYYLFLRCGLRNTDPGSPLGREKFIFLVFVADFDYFSVFGEAASRLHSDPTRALSCISHFTERGLWHG
jgi:hypothetical protein